MIACERSSGRDFAQDRARRGAGAAGGPEPSAATGPLGAGAAAAAGATAAAEAAPGAAAMPHTSQ